MDPITHGLIGAAAGLGVLSAARRGAPLRERRIAASCGFLGGEAPDVDRLVDIWYAHVWEDTGGLAYMLYHRGITHTVLACIVFAALIGGCVALLSKARAFSSSLAFLAALAGAALHLAMDATNDYGVHPFFPLSERWFYGDFLFLGEPLVGAPFLPYVLPSLGLAPRRVLPLSLGVGVVWFGYGESSEWLSWWGAAVSLTWLLLHAALQRRSTSAALAWVGAVLPLGVFFVCAHVARARTADAVAALDPAEPLTDVITTPRGANPFCFRVITVTRRDDRFHVRLGVTSLSPLVHSDTCFAPPGGPVPRSVCLAPPPPAPPSAVTWFATFTGSVREFEAWAKTSPRVDATRHFLRAPFWGPDARHIDCTRAESRAGGGPKIVIGDMRVDYDKKDLTEFCKYAFIPEDTASLRPVLPLGEPPFFQKPARSSTNLTAKP